MKLLQLQATEEISLLHNNVYQGLVEKFNNLFVRREIIEKNPAPLTIGKEGSQFYRNQVKLVGNGIRTKATVLYVNNTGLMIHDDPVVLLTVRFHLKKKGIQEITAKTVVSKIAIPQPADIITIAYNTEDLSMIAVL